MLPRLLARACLCCADPLAGLGSLRYATMCGECAWGVWWEDMLIGDPLRHVFDPDTWA